MTSRVRLLLVFSLLGVGSCAAVQGPALTCTALGCTFTGTTDNAVVRLAVINEGVHEGATPDGYTEILIQAQDEVHDASGAVACAHPPCSSNISGRLRVMSQQFLGNTGSCLGTQCPNMTELYSDGAVRLTAAGGSAISLKAEGLHTPTTHPLCIDSDGTVRLCP